MLRHVFSTSVTLCQKVKELLKRVNARCYFDIICLKQSDKLFDRISLSKFKADSFLHVKQKLSRASGELSESEQNEDEVHLQTFSESI